LSEIQSQSKSSKKPARAASEDPPIKEVKMAATTVPKPGSYLEDYADG
jgi:hypothetical protein